MKRLAAAIILAGFFFYLSFYSEAYLSRVCGEMTYKLELCAEKLKRQEYENVTTELEALQKKWDKNEVFLNIVSGDETLLGPGKNIPAIYDSVKDENYGSALALIRECQGYFEEVIESHRLSIGNIL